MRSSPITESVAITEKDRNENARMGLPDLSAASLSPAYASVSIVK